MKKQNSFRALGALTVMLTLVITCFLIVSCADSGYKPGVSMSIDTTELIMQADSDPEKINVSVIKSSRIRETYTLDWAPEQGGQDIATVTAARKNDETIYSGNAPVESSTIYTLSVKPAKKVDSLKKTVFTINLLNENYEVTDTVKFTVSVYDGVAVPTANPPDGTEMVIGTPVTLNCITPGAAIFYTIDNTAPTASSTPYTEPIPIKIKTTLKAVAVKEGNTSGTMTANYTVVAEGVIAKPFADPPAGQLESSGQLVTLACTTPDVEIYYTTNLANPTITNGTKYTGPIPITSKTTIKAMAIKGDKNSAVFTAEYTIAGAPSGPTLVSFTGIDVNGTANSTATTELTLKFDKLVPLTISSVTLDAGTTGAAKGSSFTSSGTNWKLAITGVTAAGQVSVTVANPSSAFSIEPLIQTADVFAGGPPPTAVTFDNLTANGSAAAGNNPAVRTTELYLTFSGAITGLSKDDITLTLSGQTITKGTLTNTSGGNYTLPISDFTSGGNLTVAVSKSGYSISPASKQVPIYVEGSGGGDDTEFTLKSVTADPSTGNTTGLILTFDKVIPNLAASDITLSGLNNNFNKGTLSGPSGNPPSVTYTLGLTPLAAGTLTVLVNPPPGSDYTINHPSDQAISVNITASSVVSINIGWVDDNGDLKSVLSGPISAIVNTDVTVTPSIPSGYLLVQWYLNEVPTAADTSDGKSLKFKPENKGNYNVTLLVKKDAAPSMVYSAEVVVIVN